MARSQLQRALALTITAGNMPNQGTWWWSGNGTTDTVGGTSGAGIISIGGQKADEAVVTLSVTAFNALTKIEFRAQVKDSFGAWADVDPPLLLDGPSTALRFLQVSSGVVSILAAAQGQVVRIRIPIPGATAFRFGVTPGDGNAKATAAMTAGFELIAKQLYS